VVNGNVVREITRSDLYNDFRFPDLAGVWQALSEVPAAASASRSAGLSALRQRLAVTRPAATPRVPADNSLAALYSVACDDVAWPRDVNAYANGVAIDRRLFPATAGMPADIWPCAFWPNRPVEPPVEVTAGGPRNVLVLQNLRDPATPWTSGFGLRRSASGPR
jgi:hypothetical protein